MESLKLPPRSEFPPELSHVSPWPTLGIIAFDWLVIAGAIATCKTWPSVFTYVPAVALIASRQHALFLIMHEGTHYLISKNRSWNDRISNWLAAWPVGFSTERYRIRHWIHHRYVNTDKDPDWVRKKDDPTWQFPMSKTKAWRDSLAHLCGKGVIEMTYALAGIGLSKTDLPQAAPYFAAITAAITFTGGWKTFALFWLVPYFTALPFFHRVRNASEHLALPKTNTLNGTRNVVGSPLESFFFSPHNGSYHLLHHVFPFIPWYRLPAAENFLRTNSDYARHAHENTSYFLPSARSVFNDQTTGTKPHADEDRQLAA